MTAMGKMSLWSRGRGGNAGFHPRNGDENVELGLRCVDPALLSKKGQPFASSFSDCGLLAVSPSDCYNTLLPALEMSGAVGSVVRAPRSHRGGRWFKSITAHHSDAATEPRWRNGRRAVFRAQCPYGRVGSNPTLGTKVYQALVAQQDRAQPCEG